MQIKYSKQIVAAVLGMIFLGSCIKEKEFNPPAEALFPAATKVLDYYVEAAQSSNFKIPVGITNVSDKDRTVTVSVSSPTGATEGNQFTVAAKTVTIPAGKALDSITIKGIYTAYASGRRDTLVFTIVSGTDVTVADYLTEQKVALQQYCDVVLTDFSGVYSAQDYSGGELFGDPYFVQLTPGTAAGETGFVMIEDLWAIPGYSFKVKLDWRSAADLNTEIEAQDWFEDPIQGPLKLIPGSKGKFSSCKNTFSIIYKLSTAAGETEEYITVLKK